MTPVSRVVIVALAGLIFDAFHAPAAQAQNAAAEALFREGRALIKQGNLKAGCDKLEASEKLESSVGTLLNLGDCREKQGRAASAWAAFRKAEALAKRAGNDSKRQDEAKRRAVKLEPDLASITLQIGPKSKGTGLVIRRNGELIDPAAWGDAIVVDPGAHTVIAEAPGYRPWKAEVSIGKGGKRWVVVPTLEPIDSAKTPVALVPARPTGPKRVVTLERPVAVGDAPASRTIKVQPTWSTARGVALVLGLAGAGAIGTGVYFGNRADDLQTQSNVLCPTATCDNPLGLSLNDRAQDQALRANALFIAGGAAVAAATVIWFVGKPDETTVIAPAISDNHVGASLRRRF
jgi:hypothetical protein